MTRTKVSIPGIHCEGCAALIKDVSGDYPSITNAEVDLAAKTVTLDHAGDFDLAAWKDEIESLNDAYHVEEIPHS